MLMLKVIVCVIWYVVCSPYRSATNDEANRVFEKYNKFIELLDSHDEETFNSWTQDLCDLCDSHLSQPILKRDENGLYETNFNSKVMFISDTFRRVDLWSIYTGCCIATQWPVYSAVQPYQCSVDAPEPVHHTVHCFCFFQTLLKCHTVKFHRVLLASEWWPKLHWKKILHAVVLQHTLPAHLRNQRKGILPCLAVGMWWYCFEMAAQCSLTPTGSQNKISS